MKTRLLKILSYKLTFLMVPHGAAKPRQVSLHLPFIIFMLVFWTGITAWGSYLSARHIDYWRAQASNQVLKLKVKYLLSQVEETRGYLDEVKMVDSQLRELLKYQDDRTKTASAKHVKLENAGGPTYKDQSDLFRALDSIDPDLSWDRLTELTIAMREEARNRIDSHSELNQWIETQKQLFIATPRGWPCEGSLTSHFGRRLNPFGRNNQEVHLGIDIAGPTGTPIRATADGVVRVASWKSGYGNLVVIQHNFGYQTRFAHNSRILVRVGDKVKRGQILGLMGATGRASGPHCHYEIWRYNQRKNPISYLKDDSSEQGGILTRDVKIRPAKGAKQGV